MLHHVFSMRFSTIVERFPIIKFWLLCVKENISSVCDLESAEIFEGMEIFLTYGINKEHYLITNLVGLN